MSLSFIAASEALEIRWIVYALIRDNVQHHLENGQESARFETLHRVSEALGGAPVDLPAAKLRDELATVEAELLSLPVAKLALSSRTRAVIHFQWPEVSGPSSEVVGPLASFGELTSGATTLGDVFGSTVTALRDLAAKAGPDGRVQVSDT